MRAFAAQPVTSGWRHRTPSGAVGLVDSARRRAPPVAGVPSDAALSLEEAAQGCGSTGWPTPRRAPHRCDGAPAPRSARAHDHERSGMVNDGDGKPLRTRRCSDSQRRGESARRAALVEPKQRNKRSKSSQMRPKMRPRPRTPAPTLWRGQRFALSVGGGGGI